MGIARRIRRGAGRICLADEPPRHFLYTVCGDVRYRSCATKDEGEVTCPKCLQWMADSAERLLEKEDSLWKR